MINKAFSVSQINTYIKQLLETNDYLQNIYVSGEVSNYRPNSSGHLYFSIKDEGGVIDCVMFKSVASKLSFNLENGQMIIVKGSVSVYTKSGRYQMYLTRIQMAGVGDLHVAFEQLKEKLQAEGLFDAQYKKALPLVPACVGVITSPTGSVIKDIINVATRRFPNANIKIFPCAVQGEEAGKQLAKAVRNIVAINKIDVIIIARGGGSFEDLFCFNNEELARAIFECNIPIVSAVGHETDFTICDYVSDLRAPTPSAAAEIVFPNFFDLKYTLQSNVSNLKNSLLRQLDSKRNVLKLLAQNFSITKMMSVAVEERRHLQQINLRLLSSSQNDLKLRRSNLSRLAAQLNGLSPLNVLSRGYAVVSNKRDKIVRSSKNVEIGEQIKIRLSEAELKCEVISVKDLEGENG